MTHQYLTEITEPESLHQPMNLAADEAEEGPVGEITDEADDEDNEDEDEGDDEGQEEGEDGSAENEGEPAEG